MTGVQTCALPILEESKKVGVALKSTIQEKEKYDQDGSDEDEDMAIFLENSTNL